MNISKKSWHYKMLLFVNHGSIYGMPKSICGYFWSVAILTVFVFFMSIAALAMITGLLWLLLIHPFQGGGFNNSGIICWIAIIIFSTLIYVVIATDGKSNWYKNTLLYKWLKAIKNKICPLINYKD